MAPLPKRRHSTRRGGKRHAAIRLKPPAGVKCGNCGTLIRPHSVCPKCGYYRGFEVIAKPVRKKKSKE